ncbi:ABC1 [Halocaridina rubra]|uniref:ABC1 n=1 Tax=Halocaridina rubra TaxID=373956 RepID=A0AAN8ZZN7_HALRR
MSRPPWGNDLLGLLRGLSRIGSAAAEIRSQEVTKAWATSSLRPIIVQGAINLQEKVTKTLQDPSSVQAELSKNTSEAFARLSVVAEGIKAYRTLTPPLPKEGTHTATREAYDPIYDPNITELSIEDVMMHQAMSGHEDHIAQDSKVTEALGSIKAVTDSAAANIGEVRDEVSRRLFEPISDATRLKESAESVITEEELKAVSDALTNLQSAAYGHSLRESDNVSGFEPVSEETLDIGKAKSKNELVSEYAEKENASIDTKDPPIEKLSIEDIMMQEALSSHDDSVKAAVENLAAKTSAGIDDKSDATRRIEEFDRLIDSLKVTESEITEEHLCAVSEKLEEVQNIAFGHDLRVFKDTEQYTPVEKVVEKDSETQSTDNSGAGEIATSFKDTSETTSSHSTENNMTGEKATSFEDTPATASARSEKENTNLELDSTIAQVAKSVELGVSDKVVQDIDVTVQVEHSMEAKSVCSVPESVISPESPGSKTHLGAPNTSPSGSFDGTNIGIAAAASAATATAAASATVAVPGILTAAGSAAIATHYREKEQNVMKEERVAVDDAPDKLDRFSQKLDVPENAHTDTSTQIEGSKTETKIIFEPTTEQPSQGAAPEDSDIFRKTEGYPQFDDAATFRADSTSASSSLSSASVTSGTENDPTIYTTAAAAAVSKATIADNINQLGSKQESIPAAKPKPKLLGRKPLAKDKPKSTLAENAKARKVPHSRFGRMLSFGSLAAGLGAGTIAEMTRRTLGVNQGKGSGSLLDASPFLTEANAKRIVDTLCKVRGAALKLGQMLSIQDSALINPQVQKIFERVRQSADFMPEWQLERAIIEQLGEDWKSKVSFFDNKPFAAASIGQVHLVKLPDGRPAAMKIQYPGVAEGIESDINNLISTLKVANIIPEGLYVDSVIEVAKKELGWECNYIREAECTDRYRELVKPYPEYYVPEVISNLSTKQIFTSELIEGIAVDKCVDLDQDTRNYVCEKILHLCLLELFKFGFMQTDPNWSNFFYNADTEQIALLDFGACRSYDKSFVDKYIHIIHGAATKDREKIRHYSQELGFLTGYEAKVMVNAHVDAIMILGEAFQEDKPFSFGSQDTTYRIQHLVPVMLSHRMCAPPEESYSLHRKMSGVFLLCAKLNGIVRCKPLFDEAYNSYKYGGTWEEFHASQNAE